AWREHRGYPAVVNVGVRPSFDNGQPTIEAYLLDFAGDLYGETLGLSFIRRLRGEQRFDDIQALIAQIGDIEIKQDDIAKVIVNEKTGTVVITGTVTVGTVAITQGGLTVLVQNEKQVSQPAPFSNGKTKVVDQNTITAMDEARRFQIIEGGSSLDDLVRALNAMKVTPRDVISILQAIKEAGALNADLVVI
ncbi:MAG: flagellar basal body P-ring protein FlgI, partial [Armatimonadota bacterium]